MIPIITKMNFNGDIQSGIIIVLLNKESKKDRLNNIDKNPITTISKPIPISIDSVIIFLSVSSKLITPIIKNNQLICFNSFGVFQ